MVPATIAFRISELEGAVFQPATKISVLSEAGALGTVYAYSPYGEVAVLGPDGGNDLQYAGLRNDGTGLYQATYRYYDPVLKQWISEDPIGMTGGPNLRAYVGGNPNTFNDPLGLRPPSPTLLEKLRELLGEKGAEIGGGGVAGKKAIEFGQELCHLPNDQMDYDQCTTKCLALPGLAGGGPISYDWIDSCRTSCMSEAKRCRAKNKSPRSSLEACP